MINSQQLIYDQCAVIPYRIEGSEVEVLLITTVKGKRWIIPKGLIEPDLTAQESAKNEALEEAGIEGEISAESVGEYQYSKWGGICNVEVFLMKVTDIHEDWLEREIRKRRWFAIEKAAKLIREDKLREMILQLSEWIGNASIK
ncbi:NUDIX domain-containing protein [Candidatus Saccharibacteria bacterium]|nr:NUDIX domain-containing protein [Calditrichia bacterium]NIV73160.1 NUDIX domain-containing protein [Calditrichia bacterium]NIW00514.1 NUDIX domain-containing protein [Candidatus Saccharibacteria bacterium]